MSIFEKIQRRLALLFSGYYKPRMKSGFRLADGTYLPETRISTSTYIEAPEKLTIGNNVFIGHFNFIDASQGLTIEEGCQITNYVSVLTHSSHIAIRLYGKQYGNDSMVGYGKGAVRIGKYSFIGPHSVITYGSQIGRGCLVGAYSYVKGTFPDFSIIAGNPAVVVGDTRETDSQYLEQHPELKTHYYEWANR